MLTIFQHKFCSKLLVSDFIQKFCSKHLINLFSGLLFTTLFKTLVHNPCSQFLFKILVYNSCSQHLFNNSVQNKYYCYQLMLMTFDHKFSSHIGSQLLINNFFSQPGFETFFTTFVHNKFLFPPLKGYFELLYDEARLKPEPLNTRSCFLC